MIRAIILLLPALVTLTWAILLGWSKREKSAPRLILSGFMFMSFLILCSHFFYFGPFPEIYPVIDIPLVFLATLVYPVYHIYFRLLTIDRKFSIKSHWPYLIVPFTLSLVYTFAVFTTPFSEYREWLSGTSGSVKSASLLLLESVHSWVVLIYMVQLVVCLAGNEWLLHKYGGKASQYYSNLRDTKRKYPRMLNVSAILLSANSFVLGLIDDSMLKSADILLYIIWIIFAVIFYMIGKLGMEQKALNPAFDKEDAEEISNQMVFSGNEKVNLKDQSLLLKRIIDEFEMKKIYLNSELCIMDVVLATGSNRTYISSAINQRYKQNFCTFTNTFRVKELKKVIDENPEFSADQLAERSGFGSVNSMKRAVFYFTGMQYNEFRKSAIKPWQGRGKLES